MIISEPTARLGSLPLSIDVRLAASILEQYQAELVPLYMNSYLFLNPTFMEQQLQSLHDLNVHRIAVTDRDAKKLRTLFIAMECVSGII